MDLFSTHVRRPIENEQYWDLQRTYAKGSLQFSSVLELDKFRSRKAELQKAEQSFGFVYYAEHLWLDSILSSGLMLPYADWLFSQMNKYFFDIPLKWGHFRDEDQYTTQKNKDIWVGITTGLSKIPFLGLIQDTDLEAYLRNIDSLKVSIYGERTHLKSEQLIIAFQRLFDLPYHIAENKTLRFEKDSSDFYNYDSWEIEILNINNPTNWQLVVLNGNFYQEFEFKDRFGSIREFPNYNELLKQAYEADPFLDWSPVRDYFYMPERIIHKYQDRLPAHIVDFRLKRPYLRALLHTAIECTCGVTTTQALQFTWGQLVGFPEYQVNDKIKWDEKGIGYPELDNVYAKGMSEEKCSSCGKWIETLIAIKNGHIVGIAPEKIPKIKYLFEGPFVSDDLILWNTYQQDWIRKEWSLLLTQNPDSEFQDCPSIDWKTNSQYSKEIHHLVLISKYRENMPFELFKRALMLFGVNTYNPNNAKQALSLKSQLKTCAILHLKINGEIKIAKFYWGTLLDFPEYQIGDEIRWSDYSIGEADIAEVVRARAYIDGAHHLEIIIHIKQNRIISFEMLDEKLPDGEIKPLAYIGNDWNPWLVIPDPYFIKSHRTRGPELYHLSHYSTPEQFSNVY